MSDKGFNITRNPEHDGYQRGLALVVCNCFDKKLLLRVHNQRPWLGEINYKKLAEELHKPITRKFKKRKVYLIFIDNIWGADDMQLISKFNKVIRFLLWFDDIFSKYTWVIPLKDIRRHCNY